METCSFIPGTAVRAFSVSFAAKICIYYSNSLLLLFCIASFAAVPSSAAATEGRSNFTDRVTRPTGLLALSVRSISPAVALVTVAAAVVPSKRPPAIHSRMETYEWMSRIDLPRSPIIGFLPLLVP